MPGWIAATTTLNRCHPRAIATFAPYVAEDDRTPEQQHAVARISALGDELIAADWPDPEN